MEQCVRCHALLGVRVPPGTSSTMAMRFICDACWRLEQNGTEASEAKRKE